MMPIAQRNGHHCSKIADKSARYWQANGLRYILNPKSKILYQLQRIPPRRNIVGPFILIL